MSLQLSPVAAAALNTFQNELVHLAEQKLVGSLTTDEHSVKVDQLLPSPDGDEHAWTVPTPAAPAHLEVLKVLNGWRDMDLLSHEKYAQLLRGMSSVVPACMPTACQAHRDGRRPNCRH